MINPSNLIKNSMTVHVNNCLNHISKVLITILTSILLVVFIIKIVPEKSVYNYIDLKIQYKNYIVINKEKSTINDELFILKIKNPMTNRIKEIYVKEYIYTHVYFVGDTIR